jgi:hypothetical protein
MATAASIGRASLGSTRAASREGEFGSRKSEYDIIHVCRKHHEAPKRISWAKLRRQVLHDVRDLQALLEHHQQEGLPEADLLVRTRFNHGWCGRTLVMRRRE